MLAHITGGHLSADDDGGSRSFQPMNVNFGLFPPVTVERGSWGKGPKNSKAFARKRAMAARALADLEAWLEGRSALAAE